MQNCQSNAKYFSARFIKGEEKQKWDVLVGNLQIGIISGG